VSNKVFIAKVQSFFEHALYTAVMVWYLWPHLKGLAFLVGIRVDRQRGESLSDKV
jgi:hypothetical protein